MADASEAPAVDPGVSRLSSGFRSREGQHKKGTSSAESLDVRHVATDWTEAFRTVVFEPVEARFRAGAVAERARLDALRTAGEPLVRPQEPLLDDVPVSGWDRSYLVPTMQRARPGTRTLPSFSNALTSAMTIAPIRSLVSSSTC